MPSRWDVHLCIETLDGVMPDHIHGLACRWLEPGHDQAAHRANSKPWAISPLRYDADSGIWVLELGVIDDALIPPMLDALEADCERSLHLNGHETAIVRHSGGLPAVPTILAEWSDLIDAAGADPADVMSLDFLSPTTFRQDAVFHPLPVASSVFGHYRRRWRDWGPPGSEPDLDFREVTISAAEFELRSAEYPTKRGSHVPVGVVGRAVFRIHSGERSHHRAFTQLAQVAQFTGTGANTPLGMGVTEAQPLVDHRSPSGTPGRRGGAAHTRRSVGGGHRSAGGAASGRRGSS